ncbi:hypothetical protein GCM10023192_45020 [Amycolatopsis samaneae]
MSGQADSAISPPHEQLFQLTSSDQLGPEEGVQVRNTDPETSHPAAFPWGKPEQQVEGDPRGTGDSNAMPAARFCAGYFRSTYMDTHDWPEPVLLRYRELDRIVGFRQFYASYRGGGPPGEYGFFRRQQGRATAT